LLFASYCEIGLLIILQKELISIFSPIFFASMLKGRSFPGKVLLTRRSEPLSPPEYSPRSENDRYDFEQSEGSQEVMWRLLALFGHVSIAD
jgi:hypothetical protein